MKKQINDKASPLLQQIEEETQGVLTRITPKISELEASVDRLRSRRDAVSTSLAELEPVSKQVGPLKLKIASASDYTKAAQDAQQAAQRLAVPSSKQKPIAMPPYNGSLPYIRLRRRRVRD